VLVVVLVLDISARLHSKELDIAATFLFLRSDPLILDASRARVRGRFQLLLGDPRQNLRLDVLALRYRRRRMLQNEDKQTEQNKQPYPSQKMAADSKDLFGQICHHKGV
jgi:hypothetical protein